MKEFVMRGVIFLFADLRMNVGGNIAQAKFHDACSTFTRSEIMTYGDRVDGYRFLDDWLAAPRDEHEKPIFVIHWGPHIASLLTRLDNEDVIYFAHSTGWGAEIPPSVPIFCVSRNTQAYWGRFAANSLIRYVPNIVDQPGSGKPWEDRNIDVLVQKRKSSQYLLNRLVPALQSRCSVTILDGWIDDLGKMFSDAKIYLYDSTEHWIQKNATEGFGLPPLEALGHGCIVFSSINDALSDFLEPGRNCQKLRVHSLAYDVAAIGRSLETGQPQANDPAFLDEFSPASVTSRLKDSITEAEHFFDTTRGQTSDIEDPLNYRPVLSRFTATKRFIRSLAPA